MAAGAANAGAGLGRVDVFMVAVEARGGVFEGCGEFEWAGAEFALLVVHGCLVLRLELWLCVVWWVVFGRSLTDIATLF